MTLSKNFKVFLIIGASGATALALEVLPFMNCLLDQMFGNMWMSAVRHFLIDSGIPSDFVCRYVSFALIRVGTWIILFCATLALGLAGRSWTTLSAISIAIWEPIVEFIWSAVFFLWLSPPWPDGTATQVLFSPNIWIVSLMGTVICLAGWALGRSARRFLPKAARPGGRTQNAIG